MYLSQISRIFTYIHVLLNLSQLYVQQSAGTFARIQARIARLFLGCPPIYVNRSFPCTLYAASVKRTNALLWDNAPCAHDRVDIQSTPAYKSTTMLMAATRISAAMRMMTGGLS